MSDSSNLSGLSFGTVLTLIFIVLKLTHVIDWSWWWVLAPLWIGAAVVILVLAVGVIVVGLTGGRKKP